MDNREKDETDNNSTSMLENDNSFEVKESFFEKIKGIFTRPRLGTGSNVRTTSMSFSSWSMRAIFRKALESVSNSVSSIISRKEPEVKNQFSTTVIGKDDKVSNFETTRESEETQTVSRIIPKVKAKGLQDVQVAKGIINNSKTAKDVENEYKENGIEVADIEVADFELEQEKTNNSNKDIHGIEVTSIIVNNKNTRKKDLEDERE